MSRILFTINMLQDLHIDSKLISPKYQRPIDKNRVAIIKKYILSNHNNPEFYMPDVVLNKTKNTYHIIDGQHRLHAIIKIASAERKLMNEYKGVYAVVKDNLTMEHEKNYLYP